MTSQMNDGVGSKSSTTQPHRLNPAADSPDDLPFSVEFGRARACRYAAKLGEGLGLMYRYRKGKHLSLF